jgi:hypothetical protein
MKFGTLLVFAAVAASAQQSEPPQRTITSRPVSMVTSDPKPTAGTPSKSADPPAASFDSLSKSLQDLNAIRDGNLSLVQKDGCAPELASRIADLKAKLDAPDSGVTTPAAAKPQAKAGDADPMAAANDWFKPASASKQTAPSSTRESSQLDAVLRGTPPERPAELKSSGSEPGQRLSKAEMASLKSELEQLSSACGAKK